MHFRTYVQWIENARWKYYKTDKNICDSDG
jgi:acyl-CoA thioesterase FadM